MRVTWLLGIIMKSEMLCVIWPLYMGFKKLYMNQWYVCEGNDVSPALIADAVWKPQTEALL